MADATPTSNLGFQNFYQATLTSDITASSTSIALDTVPIPTEGYLVIDPDSETNREIIYYNSKTVNTVELPDASTGRGQGGTTAVAHSSGTVVIMAPVAEYFENLQNGNIFNIGALGGTPFATGWITGVLPAVNSVTANGNRSYTIAFNSSVASTLSEGMRLRLTRTVASTQNAFSLDGVNDYYNDTTVSGMTFTDDFVVSAWVYMTSYPGSATVIASRYNGTSGWILSVESDGKVQLLGYSGASANFRGCRTYQTLPLNKWVHVAAQIDMSTYTASATTCYVMLDGTSVPVELRTGGTNPTSLTQAGNLEIGSYNGGLGPFPGYIDQVAIYSAKVTQATILASIDRPLVGTETSLVSAYSNGSTTDLNTTNANNLTAQGGATTIASAPWGNRGASSSLEYALVMSVSGANVTVQVPEGCTIPTTGGVSAVAYSTQKNPYGWVAPEGRWRIHTKGIATFTQSSPVSGTWYNINFQIYKPTGYFEVAVEVTPYAQNTTQVDIRVDATLSTTTSTETDTDLSMRTGWSGASGSLSLFTQASRRKTLDSSTAGTYYLLTQVNTATHTIVGLLGKNNLYLTPSGL